MALLGKRSPADQPGNRKAQKRKADQTPAQAHAASDDDEEDLPDDIDLVRDKQRAKPLAAKEPKVGTTSVTGEGGRSPAAAAAAPPTGPKAPKVPARSKAAESPDAVAAAAAPAETAAKLPKDAKSEKAKAAANPKTPFQNLTDTAFASLPLDKRLRRALREELRVTHLTEVQAACIPAGLEGRDVVGQARTGTGKTLAYLVPVAQRVLQDCAAAWDQTKFHTLIFAPTRLLCLQVAGVARKLFKHTKVEVGTMTKLNEKSLQLAAAPTRPHVLVAMSDKLVANLRHVGGLADTLAGLRVVVFDEVDLILTHRVWLKSKLGALYGLLPPVDQRQTLLFSVSIPTEVNKAVTQMVRPKLVQRWTETQKAALTPLQHVEQTVIVCPMLEQVGMLLHFLREEQRQHPTDYRVLVFFQTVAMVDVMEHVFHALGMDPIALHEQIPEDLYLKRVQVLEKTRRVICFANDMLSRGADFPEIHCVIQFGAPPSFQQYVHRLGRTGRAGAPGKGILILAKFEEAFTKLLAAVEPTPTVVPAPPLDGVVQALVRKAQLKLSGGVFEFINHAKRLYAAQAVYYLTKGGPDKLVPEKDSFIAILNQFVTWLFSLPEPPPMSLPLTKRLGLRDVPGVMRPQRRGVPPAKVYALLQDKQRKGLLLPRAEEWKRKKRTRSGSKGDGPEE